MQNQANSDSHTKSEIWKIVCNSIGTGIACISKVTLQCINKILFQYSYPTIILYTGRGSALSWCKSWWAYLNMTHTQLHMVKYANFWASCISVKVTVLLYKICRACQWKWVSTQIWIMQHQPVRASGGFNGVVQVWWQSDQKPASSLCKSRWTIISSVEGSPFSYLSYPFIVTISCKVKLFFRYALWDVIA